MKRAFSILLWLIAAAMLIVIASCGGVTETGNPKPTGETGGAFTPADQGQETYENATYRVRILYPFGWTATEEPDGATVTFSSPAHADGATTARVTFTLLVPAPASLFAYLADTYPDRTFSIYTTPSLVGYTYNDPAGGPAGGDLREYFFLNANVLVAVAAELEPATTEEFFLLLEGIEFF